MPLEIYRLRNVVESWFVSVYFTWRLLELFDIRVIESRASSQRRKIDSTQPGVVLKLELSVQLLETFSQEFKNRVKKQRYKLYTKIIQETYHSPGGTKPERVLLRKSRVSSWGMLSRVFGIVPKRLLKLKSSLLNILKFPKLQGTSPVSLLCCRDNTFSFFKDPMVIGIFPVKLLQQRSMTATKDNTTQHNKSNWLQRYKKDLVRVV